MTRQMMTRQMTRRGGKKRVSRDSEMTRGASGGRRDAAKARSQPDRVSEEAVAMGG
jgi:hypothetical protein